MKHFYIISCLYFFVSINHKCNSQNIEVTKISTHHSNESKYVLYEKVDTPLKRIENAFRTNSWHFFNNWFKNSEQCNEFLSKFIYPENHPHSIELAKFGNKSQISKLKPFTFQSVKNGTFTLFNIVDKSIAKVSFSLDSTSQFIIGADVIINNKSSYRNGTIETPINFVRLANHENDIPEYYNNYLSEFQKNLSPDNSNKTSIPFRQVDFDPLEIKLRVCKKFIGVNFCKNVTHEYTYGKVISGKDIPGNGSQFFNKYFGEITDLTAFNNYFKADYIPNGYVQTAIVVDKIKSKITFFREGLEPWDYGINSNEYKFNSPIAVKEIGGFIYILDLGNNEKASEIVILRINHSADGNFSVNYIGSINSSNLNSSFSNPKDIGGFESSSNLFVTIADEQGIHIVPIDKSTGLPFGNSTLITTLKDPYNSQSIVEIKDVVRLDGNNSSGHVVLITLSNKIVSVPIQQIISNSVEKFFSYIAYLQPPYFPSNLAYMEAEEKWYITDLNGKLHTLSKEGRYSGGGGQIGKSEDNGELYLPNAITPNTIKDPNNNFRYRFIVANKWDYETGFKLFAPGMCIPEFKIFENLNSGNITFAFTTSGKWQYIEKATGMYFSSLKINGVNISQSQISNTNDLTNVPNILDFKITDLANGLKRGWNKANLNIVINKNDGSIETVVRELDFYWLPSDFTSQLTDPNEFTLNQQRIINNKAIDFIYKPIIINNNAAFVVKNGNVKVSTYGNLTFNSGSTFYNMSDTYLPLSNIAFEDTSKFYISPMAHICVNIPNNNPKKPYEMPSLNEHIKLSKGYILGVNSLLNWDNNLISSCISPCEFMAHNKSKAIFDTQIDFNSGPSFSIITNPKGSTYSDFVKWEVQKVVANNEDSLYKSHTIQDSAYSINLKSTLNYDFKPCFDYKISFSIGCNQIGYIKTVSKYIKTYTPVNAGKDTTLCTKSGNVKLIGNSPDGGIWSGNSSLNSSGFFNVLNSNISIPQNTVYTYTDKYGCTKSDNKLVTVFETPLKPSISGNNIICSNSTLELEASSVEGAYYNWYFPQGQYTLHPPKFKLYNVKQDRAGSFKVLLVKDNCSSDTAYINVIIRPLPNVTAGNDTLLCKMSSSIWLTTGKPQGSVAYWYGKGVGNYNFLPNVAGVGVHPLTYVYTDTNGCTNSAIRNITVGPVLTATNESVCTNNIPYTLGGVTPTGGTWSGTAVTSAGVFTPANSPIGTQYLTYTATANGCSNSIQKQVTVKATPATPYLTVQPRETVCEGGSVTLAVSTIISGITYKITGPNGFVADLASTTLYKFTEAQSGLYNITATKDGCTNSPNGNTVRRLFFSPLPIVNAGIDEITCTYIPKLILKNASPTGGSWSGEGYKKDTFLTNTGKENPSGPPPFSSGGAPPPPLIKLTQDVFLPSGKTQSKAYTLTYTYTHPTTGCSNSDTKEIKIGGNPTVRIESSNNDTTCGNAPAYTDLAAIAENSFDYRYQWYKNGNPIAGATSPVIRVTAPARYGCVVNASCGGGAAEYEVKNTKEWIRLEGANYSTVGISSDKNLWMWGGNKPIGRPEDKGKPGLVDSSGSWKEVSYNIYDNTLHALKENGTLWSFNRDKTEYFGGYTDVPPTQIGTDSDWQKIKGGTNNNTLGLKKNGTIWGWGRSVQGQIGVFENYLPNPTQIGVDADWKDISTADGKFVGIKRDGSLWQWGLIVKTTGYYSTAIPERVDYNNDWDKVIGGFGVCMGIKTDKSLWTWGVNSYGEAGIGSIEKIDYPQRITMDYNWKDVKLGLYHTIAIKENGEVWIWGANQGIGVEPGDVSLRNNFLYPVKTSLSNVHLIATGGTHTVVSKKCSMELCGSGDNTSGQLGIGNMNGIYRGFSCLGTNPSNPPIRRGNPNLYRTPTSTSYLLSPMPNPASSFTNIFYKIPLNKQSKLIVYDLVKENLMQEYMLDNFQQEAHQLINTSNLINGVYMVSLEIEGIIVATQKLIILK